MLVRQARRVLESFVYWVAVTGHVEALLLMELQMASMKWASSIKAAI